MVIPTTSAASTSTRLNSDAKIVAYKDEEAMLEKIEPEPESGIWCAVFHEGRHPLEDGDELKVGDVTLKFIHTPKHTEGGMCIYVKEAKALF